jgi:hypothetical protein
VLVLVRVLWVIDLILVSLSFSQTMLCTLSFSFTHTRSPSHTLFAACLSYTALATTRLVMLVCVHWWMGCCTAH